MPDLRRAPARPRQTVVVAADLRIVLGRAQRHQIELLLVPHVRLQPLRRLAGVAGAPASAIYFAQDVLGHRTVAFDLDVLEHQVGEAELLGHQIQNLIVVLGLEARRNDRLAPLHAIGWTQRANPRSRTGCISAADTCCPCVRPPTASDAQVVGCGSATTSRSSFGNAFIDSGIRVMLLLACPCTNIARTLSF